VKEKMQNYYNVVEFFFANEPRCLYQEDQQIAPWIDTIHGEDLLGSMEFLSPSSEENYLLTLDTSLCCTIQFYPNIYGIDSFRFILERSETIS